MAANNSADESKLERNSVRPKRLTPSAAGPDRARKLLRTAEPHQLLGAALVGTWVATTLGLLIASAWHQDLEIAIFGSLGSAIATTPLLLRGYSWISPWSLVIVAVYAGFGVRGFAIAARGTDDPLMRSMYTLGHDWSESRLAFALVLAGLALMTFGYALAHLRGTQTRIPWGADYQFGGHIWWVVGAFACLGFVGLAMFVARTGGLDVNQLSAKRTAYYTSDGAYAGGQGQWRMLNDLSAVALWIATAKLAQSRSRLRVWHAIVLGVLGANALLLPYYASTRSNMLYILLTAAAVWVYIRRDRVPWKSLAVLGVFGLLLLSVVSFQRQQSEGSAEAYTVKTALTSISDAAVVNLNFTEIPKTANIIDAIPETLDYTYGQTIANYLVAPIPRSLWPDKPLIDAGVEVGVEVYKTDGSSIPPGALGELYWSWGVFGITIGALAFGFALGWVERLFRNRTDAAAAVLYAGAVLDLGYNAVSGSIGYAAFSALLGAVPIAIALVLAGSEPGSAVKAIGRRGRRTSARSGRSSSAV